MNSDLLKYASDFNLIQAASTVLTVNLSKWYLMKPPRFLPEGASSQRLVPEISIRLSTARLKV